tara:strand:- start:807 stop:1223 length:417 start_codon:yes stop_codon:yes gene_type:complete
MNELSHETEKNNQTVWEKYIRKQMMDEDGKVDEDRIAEMRKEILSPGGVEANKQAHPIVKYFNFDKMITPSLLKGIHLIYPVLTMLLYFLNETLQKLSPMEYFLGSVIAYIPFRMILEGSILIYSIHETLVKIKFNGN